MKKLLTLVFSLLMALSLVGCSSDKPAEGSTGSTEGKPEIVDLSTIKGLTADFTVAFSSDFDRMDYLATSKNPNHIHNVNFVDGLLENDPHGNYIPALAESYEANDDSTVWTFKLRKGVKWVNAEGEEYAEVTADDFVAGLQHAVDATSETLSIVQNLITNLDAYVNGKVGFEEVGVKAIDDYTLQYTLSKSTPYFDTMTTYAILFPANRSFLVSKGCTPGGDQANCTFGGTTPDSILYNGAFILTANDAKSKITYVKNEKYWDKDNVHFNTVNYIFDDGSDAYSVMKGFQSGTYVAAALNTKWADYQEYADKYSAYKTISMPNATTFGILINYNRKNFHHTNKTVEEQKAAQEALMNKNVRLAIQAAYDSLAYNMVSQTKEVSLSTLRNMNNAPDLVHTTDGKKYGDLVTDAYNKLTGLNYDLNDGHPAFYNPEKAKEYIAAAEAEGIKFPIILDVLMPGDRSEIFVNRAQSLKESIETNTDKKIIIDVQLRPMDVVSSVCFTMADPDTAADYDINTFAGWGPDYVDPMTYAHTFILGEGEYMKNIGLLSTGNAEEDIKIDEIAKKLGFDKYTEMVLKADAITDTHLRNERYQAFAEADAFLLAQGLYLPTAMGARAERVSRVVPFSAPFSMAGSGGDKLKFVKLSESVITKEQYEAAKTEWEKNVK